MKESLWLPVVVCVLVVGLAVVVFQAPKTVVVSSGQEQELYRLSVSGDAKLSVAADMAVLFLRTEVTHPDPRVAQDKDSVLVAAAINALVDVGVDRKSIETTNYQVYRVQEWNPKTQTQEEKGYRVSHTLRVETTRLNKIGTFLKVAVDAGVNEVERVEFLLSKEKQKEIKQQALSAAAKVAQEKAEVLASSLGVRLGKVVSVGESSFDVFPMPRFVQKEMFAAEAAAPPIQPGEVNAQTSVSVVFEIL